MKKPNYIEYRQHLETMAPIMEELRASTPQAIARALIQRGIPNAQGEVKWSVRRVEAILKRLAPLTPPSSVQIDLPRMSSSPPCTKPALTLDTETWR